jgi:SAM-dependent methyltransferase
MKNLKLSMRFVLIPSIFFITTTLLSQEKGKQPEFQPEVGQEGKDVVWVPTPQALVDKMLDLAKVTKEDFLVDLGSGDGRTVITAAKRGVKAMGIEFNPNMVALSRKNAAEAGVENLAQFMEGDLFAADFSKATVVTMFLLPDINLRLRPILLNMKPGTRIVTNTFTMQDWNWDETASTDNDESSWTTAYLWIIPAKVEGRWRMGESEIVFLQEFQMLSGEITTKNKKETITDGKLRGSAITFSVGDAVYNGTVGENSMEGTCTKGGKTTQWKAVR